MPRIFDSCYRAETCLTRRAKGAGLQLFFTWAVLEGHGGRIRVKPEMR